MTLLTKIDETLSWLDTRILLDDVEEESMLRLISARADIALAKSSIEGGGSEPSEGSNTSGQTLTDILTTIETLGDSAKSEKLSSTSIVLTANNATISGSLPAAPAGKAYYITHIVFSFSAPFDGFRELKLNRLTQVGLGTEFFKTYITAAGTGPINLDYTSGDNSGFAYSLDASGTDGTLATFTLFYKIIDL